MSLIHAAASFQGNALVHGGNFYPAIAIGLALVHGIRSLTVNDARAAHWLSERGFLPETRDIAYIRGYLLRLRVSRFVGALRREVTGESYVIRRSGRVQGPARTDSTRSRIAPVTTSGSTSGR